MEFKSDSSMLSDELKPRRTPVPASFGVSVPRPSVPDLSIIETPETGAANHHQPVSLQAPPALSHLSYNDWRSKTGGTVSAGFSRSITTSQLNHKPSSGYAPASSVIRAVPVESHNRHHNGRVEEHSARTQPSERAVSYSEFKHRPSSAPVVRAQHVPSYTGREHPLSKSAPPTRISTQHEPPRQHQVVTSPNSMVPQNLNYQPQPTGSSAPQSSAPRQHLPHMQGPNNLSLVPSSQNVDVRRLEHSVSPRGCASQMAPAYEIPSKDQMRSHIHYANNNVPSPNLYNHSEALHPAYQMKTMSPYPYGEQVCYPAVPAMIPHQMQPMPPFVMQHPAPPQVSYEDLYKIVLAQNDQLKALQSQVERLLVSKDEKPPAVSSSQQNELDKLPVVAKTGCKTAVFEEGTQTSGCEEREDDSEKMSIGVMTSFIHAVAYRGRVGRRDPAQNFSEQESGNHSKQSKSSLSDDSSSSSPSPASKSPKSQNSCSNCCKDCSTDKHQDKPLKHVSKNGRPKLNSKRASGSDSKKSSSSNMACPEGCNCNNPGVSAAITAVRGCQAVLASKAGVTAHDFSTFNGADLPTVREQAMSPMSSMHVDLHDYRSSSSDGESSVSHSEDDASSEEGESIPVKDQEAGTKHNGWTFYNNVLGQVNKILEEREMEGSSPNTQKAVAVPNLKLTDVSVSKRVAFEAQGANGPPPNLKEMAIRYLKENHPEELAVAGTKKSKKPRSEKLQEMAMYNMPASDMSFATFRYLERYNLLPENFNPELYLEAAANIHGLHGSHQGPSSAPVFNGGGKKSARVPSGKVKARSNFPLLDPCHEERSPRHLKADSNPVHLSPRQRQLPQQNTPTSKILDITTLRQQPKLL